MTSKIASVRQALALGPRLQLRQPLLVGAAGAVVGDDDAGGRRGDNVAGGILSSLTVTSLPEALRFMARSRMVVYSLILLLVLRYTNVLNLANLKRMMRRPKVNR